MRYFKAGDVSDQEISLYEDHLIKLEIPPIQMQALRIIKITYQAVSNQKILFFFSIIMRGVCRFQISQ